MQYNGVFKFIRKFDVEVVVSFDVDSKIPGSVQLDLIITPQFETLFKLKFLLKP